MEQDLTTLSFQFTRKTSDELSLEDRQSALKGLVKALKALLGEQEQHLTDLRAMDQIARVRPDLLERSSEVSIDRDYAAEAREEEYPSDPEKRQKKITEVEKKIEATKAKIAALTPIADDLTLLQNPNPKARHNMHETIAAAYAIFTNRYPKNYFGIAEIILPLWNANFVTPSILKELVPEHSAGGPETRLRQ